METRKRDRRNDSESTNSKSPTMPTISKLKNEPGRPESPAYATRSRKKIDDNLESLSANLNDQRRPRSQRNSESELGSLASSTNNSPTRPLKKTSGSVDSCDSKVVEQKAHRMTAKLNEVKRRTLRGRIIEEPNSLDVAKTMLDEVITRQARVILIRIGDDWGSHLGTLHTVPSHQPKCASVVEKDVQNEQESLEDWCEDEEHSQQTSETKNIDNSSDEEPFTKGLGEKHKKIIESDSGSDSEEKDSEDEGNHVKTRKSRIKQKSKKQTPSRNTRTNKCEMSPVLSKTKGARASQLSPKQTKTYSEEHATSLEHYENTGLSSKYRGTPPKDKTKSPNISIPPAVVDRLVSFKTKFLDYSEELLPEVSENKQVALENESEKCLESDVSIDSVSTVEAPSTPFLDTNNAGIGERKSPGKSTPMMQSPGKVQLSSEKCSEAEGQSLTSNKSISPSKSSSVVRETSNFEETMKPFKKSSDISEVETNKPVSPRRARKAESPVKERNNSKSPGKSGKTVQLDATEESDASVELQTKSRNAVAKLIEECEENDADNEMPVENPTSKATQEDELEESDNDELPSQSPSKSGRAAEQSEESDSDNKQSPIKCNKFENDGLKLTSNTIEQENESSDDIKSDDSSPFKCPFETDKAAATSTRPESSDDELPNVSPSKSNNAALNASNKGEKDTNQSPNKSGSENELPTVSLSELDKVSETRKSAKSSSKSPSKTNINITDSSDESEIDDPPKKSPAKANKGKADSSDESEIEDPLAKYPVKTNKHNVDSSDEGDEQPTTSPVKSNQREIGRSDESEIDDPLTKSPVKANKHNVDSSDEGDKQPTTSPAKSNQRKTDSSDEQPKKSPVKDTKSKIDNSKESDEDNKLPTISPAKTNKRKLDSSDDGESDEIDEEDSSEHNSDAELQKNILKNDARRNRKSILNVSEDETASPQTRLSTNKNSSNVDSSKTLSRKSDPKRFTHLQSLGSSDESELSGSETPQKPKLATQISSKVNIEAKAKEIQSKQPKPSAVTTPRVNKPLTIIERLNQCFKNLPATTPELDKEQKQTSAQHKKQQPVSVASSSTSSESEDTGESEIEYRMVKIIPKSSTSAKQTSLPTKKKAEEVASSTSENSSEEEIETVKTITKPTAKVSASTKTSTLTANRRVESRVSSESDDSSDNDIEIVRNIARPTEKVTETGKTSALPAKRKGEDLVSPLSKKPKQWSWFELNDNKDNDLWGSSVIKSTVKGKRDTKESSLRQQRKLDLEKQLRALRNWNVTEVQETAKGQVHKDWNVTKVQEDTNVPASSAWQVTAVAGTSGSKKKRNSSVLSDSKDSSSQSSAIPSKQGSQIMTNGGKKSRISELNKVTNEHEDSDSDDAPDEQSFTASRMSAFAVIKNAMQSAQLGEQAAKKKRREKHERFMAQKQNSEKTDEKATVNQGQTKSKADGQQQDKKILGSKLPMSVLEQLDPQTTTTKSKKKKQKQQSQPVVPTEVHSEQIETSQQSEEQPKSKSQLRREKKRRNQLLAAAQAHTNVSSEPQTSHVTKFVIADPTAVEAATKSKADKWRQRVMNLKPKLSATKANAIKERLKWSNQGQKISTWAT